jgi:hypothetical protein
MEWSDRGELNSVDPDQGVALVKVANQSGPKGFPSQWFFWRGWGKVRGIFKRLSSQMVPQVFERVFNSTVDLLELAFSPSLIMVASI